MRLSELLSNSRNKVLTGMLTAVFLSLQLSAGNLKVFYPAVRFQSFGSYKADRLAVETHIELGPGIDRESLRAEGTVLDV